MRNSALTRRRLCSALVTLIPAGTLTTLAAEAGAEGAPDATPSLLRQVIEQPSGRNGYEEFLIAAELVNLTPALTTEPAATLTQKRGSVAAGARAMAIFRQGLRKPFVPPRSTFTIGMSFPEAELFGTLGRLLMVEQYLLLADGHTQAAEWRNDHHDGHVH